MTLFDIVHYDARRYNETNNETARQTITNCVNLLKPIEMEILNTAGDHGINVTSDDGRVKQWGYPQPLAARIDRLINA